MQCLTITQREGKDMKKVWLILLICFVLQIAVAQLSAQITVTIGAGDQQALIPFNFYYYYSLYETLYYPDEIQMAGVIDNIKYYNNFTMNLTQNIQIWMGETTQPDLSQGWIPSSQLTLVYDGTMVFPQGQNVVSIPLTVPYCYTGTNLVIMTRNPYMSAMTGPEVFYCQTVGTNRARSFYSDTTNPDPTNPPTTGGYYSLTGQFPKTTLNFVTTMWHDLTAVSITGNPTPIQFIPSPYLVTINNSGDYYQSQYTVKLFNTANQELASVPGTPLNPGQTTQIPVPWIPLIIENTGIYGKVVMADDAFSFNNQTAVLNIAVQPGGVIIDPPPPDIYTRVPVDMYYQNSLFETIFSENYWYLYNIPSPCYITTISFYNNFVTTYLDNMPTKVWLGNTAQTDLTAGWIPSTQLTPVFDGNINYPPGQNSITIVLPTPFLYTGGNLAMMVNRPMDTQYYSSNDVFACYNGIADCSRRVYSDGTLFDPANPPVSVASLSNIFPVTAFNFSLNGFGSLSGVIRNSQNQPIAGASVGLGLNMTTISDSSGCYSFEVVPEGTYQVSVSKPGYVTTTQTAVITDGENTVLDFILPSAPFASISGRVVNSLAPALGIGGVLITLSGFYNATTTTSVDGNFVLNNIPSYNTYSIIISMEGYQSSTITVQLDNFDFILGNLPLVEIAVAPYNVYAAGNAQNTGFNITWSPPYLGNGEWVHYDTAVHARGINMYSNIGIPIPFDAAIRFTTEDLAAYAGMSLLAVKFYALNSTSEHRIQVWTGGNQDDAGVLVVDQPVANPTANAWNEISLNTPVFISGYDELWIGVHYGTSAIAPASCDDGPVHNWRGNLISTGGGWGTLYYYMEDWVYNWNIQGLLDVDTSRGRQVLLPLADNPVYHETGILKCEKNPNPAYTVVTDASSVSNPIGANGSTELNRTLTGYKVWRFEQGQQNNPELWTLITPNPITATAYFDQFQHPSVGTWVQKWAVKAIYTGNQYSPPAFSNSIMGGIWAGIIEGTITNSTTGLPVCGALVHTDPNMNQAFSNAEGHYSFVRPPDSYILHAEAENYEPFQQGSIQVTDGDTTTVDIAMVPIVHNPEEPVYIMATVLKGCYPNPFNSRTTVSFEIKDPVQIAIEIYNTKGQRIKTLSQGLTKTGRYSIVWDGKDNNSRQVSGGVYLCKMTAGRYASVRKLILIR